MNQIPNFGHRVTFQELFTKHPLVEIPIIQRDYAQGRPSQSEVRTDNSWKALYTALSKMPGDPSLPLDLDFIYGGVEGTSRNAFWPLDGQQRLTTLFLLHWYLACKDRRSNDFVSFIKEGQKSRFAYAVRPSSGEFFDALVSYNPDFTARNGRNISSEITDQPWFYRSWNLDPTIQSALVMLGDIDAKFNRTEGYYGRLIQTESPYVTFQLLNLRSFGLSDDLYIKMNARGKPLTSFETFKARLEQHLDTVFGDEKRELHGKSVSLKEYFSYRIDTAWADLFWLYRDRMTNLFDNQVLHVVRALAVITREPTSPGVDAVIQSLRNRWQTFSFFAYQELGCLDRPLLDTLICLLDSCSGVKGQIRTYLAPAYYYDEKATFNSICVESTNLSYTQLVQLHAYAGYIREHRATIQPQCLDRWMRVIGNLAINTPYDGLDEFKRSIRSINELLRESDRILECLTDTKAEIRGFYEQQIREEKIKAHLILKNQEWETRILAAEKHGYFKGQIEFLLKFCGVFDAWAVHEKCDWDDPSDAAYLQAFSDYCAKASAMFTNHGLYNLGENRWERALLSVGDYMLRKGRNYSFLDNTDRDASWKRLLRAGLNDDHAEKRRSYVKTLLDSIDLDKGAMACLDHVIANAQVPEKWRRVAIERPEIIDYCKGRMIRYQSENSVFLLKKSQMNGEHAELFSYHLFVAALREKGVRGDFTPFNNLDYSSVNTEAEAPGVRLYGTVRNTIMTLHISNDAGKSRASMWGVPEDEFKQELIQQVCFIPDGTGWLNVTVDADKIEMLIHSVVKWAKQNKEVSAKA